MVIAYLCGCFVACLCVLLSFVCVCCFEAGGEGLQAPRFEC